MRLSRTGGIVAGVYLLVVLIVCVPLFKDLAIHHGNAIAFFAAAAATSPLSWLFLWLVDRLLPVNAFYQTGWLFALDIGILTVCALVNAAVIVFLFSREEK